MLQIPLFTLASIWLHIKYEQSPPREDSSCNTVCSSFFVIFSAISAGYSNFKSCASTIYDYKLLVNYCFLPPYGNINKAILTAIYCYHYCPVWQMKVSWDKALQTKTWFLPQGDKSVLRGRKEILYTHKILGENKCYDTKEREWERQRYCGRKQISYLVLCTILCSSSLSWPLFFYLSFIHLITIAFSARKDY